MQTGVALYPLGSMKKVLILGSTGSIGTQALEVIGRSDALQAVGLAAGSGWELTVAAGARARGAGDRAVRPRRGRAGAWRLERPRALR